MKINGTIISKRAVDALSLAIANIGLERPFYGRERGHISAWLPIQFVLQEGVQ
jgi:hypothetical protein